MVMNGFDTNFDADNEVYAVNTVAHHFMHEPIRVEVGRLARMYLVNVTEFDSDQQPAPARHVLRRVPHRHVDDAVRDDRHGHAVPGGARDSRDAFRYPGEFMFHAHQSEFAELGWMGLFEAVEVRRDT